MSMITLNVTQLMERKAGREGRPVTLAEVAEATGISYNTLHRQMHDQALGVYYETLEKLAAYFGLDDLGPLLSWAPDGGAAAYPASRNPALRENAGG